MIPVKILKKKKKPRDHISESKGKGIKMMKDFDDERNYACSIQRKSLKWQLWKGEVLLIMQWLDQVQHPLLHTGAIKGSSSGPLPRASSPLYWEDADKELYCLPPSATYFLSFSPSLPPFSIALIWLGVLCSYTPESAQLPLPQLVEEPPSALCISKKPRFFW